MKKVILTLIALLVCSFSSALAVEGQIIYDSTAPSGSLPPPNSNYTDTYSAPTSSSSYTGLYLSGKVIGAVSRYTRESTLMDFDGKWNGMQWGGGLAAGYNFKPVYAWPIRAELEFSFLGNSKYREKSIVVNGTTYTSSKISGLQIFTMFANAYLDFNINSVFTPYATFGIGMASISSDGAIYGSINNGTWNFGSKTTRNFAWNLGGGVSYAFTDKINFDAGYRYAHLGSADNPSEASNMGVTSLKRKNLGQHQFSLGARYTF